LTTTTPELGVAYAASVCPCRPARTRARVSGGARARALCVGAARRPWAGAVSGGRHAAGWRGDTPLSYLILSRGAPRGSARTAGARGALRAGRGCLEPKPAHNEVAVRADERGAEARVLLVDDGDGRGRPEDPEHGAPEAHALLAPARAHVPRGHGRGRPEDRLPYRLERAPRVEVRQHHLRGGVRVPRR